MLNVGSVDFLYVRSMIPGLCLYTSKLSGPDKELKSMETSSSNICNVEYYTI